MFSFWKLYISEWYCKAGLIQSFCPIQLDSVPTVLQLELCPVCRHLLHDGPIGAGRVFSHRSGFFAFWVLSDDEKCVCSSPLRASGSASHRVHWRFQQYVLIPRAEWKFQPICTVHKSTFWSSLKIGLQKKTSFLSHTDHFSSSSYFSLYSTPLFYYRYEVLENSHD